MRRNSLMRGISIPMVMENGRNRNRTTWRQRRPRLESLEERQLLSTASFLGSNTTTQGNWIGTYGSQGYDVINNASSLPSYATVTPAGQTSYTWAANTTDPRALQDAGGSGRIAATWYSASSFTVDVNLTDGQTHDLELYFLDWDTTSRGEQVQISNASTGAVLSTQTVTSFHSGVYLQWAVSGNLLITFTNMSGNNAVLSGLFLDPPPTTPPTVTAESPASGATNVALASSVSATFSEPVQSSTISFSLTPSGGSPVAASVSYNSSTQTATLTPSSALAYTTTYTASVSGAVSIWGGAMTGPFSWSFTSAPNWPTVTSETPAESTLEVPLASPITATFNQAVQSSTIVFTLTNDFGNSVAGTVSYNSSTDTAALTPSTPLAASTTYTATVSGAKSSSGYAMTAPAIWEFITDPGSPTVTSETPASSSTGVGTATTVAAAFSEPVQSGTVSFTLESSGGKSVGATVTYNPTTFVALLTPSAPLAASTTYTATISGAQDLAGDPMSGSVTWSFTTSAAAPATPTVTAESPTITGRIAAAWYSATKFTVGVDLTDGQEHDLELYLLDWDHAGRREQVQISNAATGAVLSTETASSFNTGVYLDFEVSGNILITFTDQLGANAVLNGLFLDPPATPTPTSTTTASFVTEDAATQGNWAGTYGADGYDVIGGQASLPSYATVTPSGESSYTWTSATTDPRALQIATPGVSTVPTITATFNEAVQSGTISFTLKNSSGTVISGTLSYNSATATQISLAPSTILAYCHRLHRRRERCEEGTNGLHHVTPAVSLVVFMTAAAPRIRPRGQ